MPADRWDPPQYQKFQRERTLPFADLMALVSARPRARIIDLGCGTGELTAALADRFPGAEVLGVDSSAAMLEPAAAHASPRVRFERADISAVTDLSAYDLVFSHAALHWLPDHKHLFRRMLRSMKSGAELAVQMPKSGGHPSHTAAIAVAKRPPFSGWLGGYVRRSEVLALERYAELLYQEGASEQVCLERIYGHLLADASQVVEWVKGTLLTAYLERLDEQQQEAFLEAYRDRLLTALGESTPYFYPFRRVLLWCRKS